MICKELNVVPKKSPMLIKKYNGIYVSKMQNSQCPGASEKLRSLIKSVKLCPWPEEKNQPIEMDPRMMEMTELANKDLKLVSININYMLCNIKESVDMTRRDIKGIIRLKGNAQRWKMQSLNRKMHQMGRTADYTLRGKIIRRHPNRKILKMSIPICCCSSKAAAVNTQTNRHGYVPIKLYLQHQAVGRIWPDVTVHRPPAFDDCPGRLIENTSQNFPVSVSCS